MENLRLKGIFIYPVKSLTGIAVREAYAGERGLENDRRWMLIDSENNFITQRKFHNLALTKLRIENNFIIIGHKEKAFGEVKIPLIIQEGESIKATVWDDSVKLLWPKLSADKWFSELLETDVRLVYMPDESTRQVDTKYVTETLNTSLSDGYPYLLVNLRSVDDVSERAGIKIETERFRPNIVIETERSFEEDNLKKITIGKITFRIVKPSARCVLTTIDPQTGIAGKEPLQTLNTYRNFGNKILFGQNMTAENHGIIRVGDEIKLIQ